MGRRSLFGMNKVLGVRRQSREKGPNEVQRMAALKILIDMHEALERIFGTLKKIRLKSKRNTFEDATSLGEAK